MRCPVCNGSGRVRGRVFCASGPFEAILPCNGCNGSGVTHCCEGENVDRASAMLAATECNPNEGEDTQGCA